MTRASLALESGLVLVGESFGADGEITGELVFNTSITGYQEIITDPSYKGQIVTMTYPLIGNYGINPDDLEGAYPHVSALVVREYSEFPGNFRATDSLASWLQGHGTIGIQGIDTRMLTRVIREKGALRAVISTMQHDPSILVEKARRSPVMSGLDLAKVVTCARSMSWSSVDTTPFALNTVSQFSKTRVVRVVVYDFGVKRNILRRLVAYGCELTVVPATTTAEDVLAMNPDGIFLSNGPGDPEAVTYAIENIKILMEHKPIFGICLGHQLLALALGGKTYKMKFGHRGANHPVMNHLTQEIEITSQNHGFAVDADSLDAARIEVTHTNLNDGTNEGLRHRELPIFSVQYHPEASPGPHDSDYLFSQFIAAMHQHASSDAHIVV